MGVVYMAGIEVSPGCGRLSSPGLGMIPVWRCMARGDGVSARLQDTGLPVGLSLLSPGDTSRVPRWGSSARRASILKFFDFSIATLLDCLELDSCVLRTDACVLNTISETFCSITCAI